MMIIADRTEPPPRDDELKNRKELKSLGDSRSCSERRVVPPNHTQLHLMRALVLALVDDRAPGMQVNTSDPITESHHRPTNKCDEGIHKKQKIEPDISVRSDSNHVHEHLCECACVPSPQHIYIEIYNYESGCNIIPHRTLASLLHRPSMNTSCCDM